MKFSRFYLLLVPVWLAAACTDKTEESLRVLQDLLPDFHRGEILDFTELFLGQAPSKKRRLGHLKPHCEWSSLPELSRVREVNCPSMELKFLQPPKLRRCN